MSALNFLSVILSHCRKFGVESKAYDLTPRYACQHRLETDHFSMILTLSALTLCLYSILPGNGYIGFIFMQTCSVKSERREIQDDTSPADLETINVFRCLKLTALAYSRISLLLGRVRVGLTCIRAYLIHRGVR